MKTTLENTDAAYMEFDGDGDGATETGRLLPDCDEGKTEWREDGTIDGVPVTLYYMTDDGETAEILEGNGGDAGGIDWAGNIERVEVNLIACDRDEAVTDEMIEALVKKYELQ